MYTIPSVDQPCRNKLAELLAILDSFYTSITSDYIGVKVEGGGSHKMANIPCIQMVSCEAYVFGLKMSQIRSSQFDGQVQCEDFPLG